MTCPVAHSKNLGLSPQSVGESLRLSLALTLSRGFTPGDVKTSSFSKLSHPGDDFRIRFICGSTSSSSGTTGGLPGGVSGWDSGVQASFQRKVSGWRPLTKYRVSPTPREPSDPGFSCWVPAVEGLTPSCKERGRNGRLVPPLPVTSPNHITGERTCLSPPANETLKPCLLIVYHQSGVWKSHRRPSLYNLNVDGYPVEAGKI